MGFSKQASDVYCECMTDRKRQIERLFRQHYRAMYKLANILLHDEEESMDIVHDVFARLLEDDKPLQEATARAFLLSSVRNQCLNVMRDRKIDERARGLLMLESEVSSRDAEDLEARISTLYQGIAELMPPACREVITLHYRDGLTFREIAQCLNVSETTVYKHLRHALEQLRQTLKTT